uniref:TCTP domain-containing protein n=1 Tax=Octopus bimaculoides TaxID=37653 RepID=A0A0L8GJ03_OCTBM
MIIYKDIVTGDELFSDAYPMKELHGIAFEVEGKYITGQSETFDIGANPSAEEASETYNDVGASGINIVLYHRLVEVYIDKPYFKDHLKSSTKKIVDMLTETNKDRVEPFKASAVILVKELIKRFKELRFFVVRCRLATWKYIIDVKRKISTNLYANHSCCH